MRKKIGRGLPLPPHPQIDPIYTVCEKWTQNLGRALPPFGQNPREQLLFFRETFPYIPIPPCTPYNLGLNIPNQIAGPTGQSGRGGSSRLFTLLSVIRQQMSAFCLFGGWGCQKQTMSLFTIFFKRASHRNMSKKRG